MSGCHHYGRPAERMSDHAVKASEMALSRDDGFRCDLQVQPPPARRPMPGQVEHDDLRARLAETRRKVREILDPRSPAMHQEHPPAIGGHALHGQDVDRRHAARQCKPHRLRLPKPVASGQKDLLRLRAFRATAWRPAEELEGKPPGQSRRHLLQPGESEPGDLERKGWHSRNPIECSMLNNKVQE